MTKTMTKTKMRMTDESVRDIVSNIDQRIDLLHTVKAAVLVAFGLDREFVPLPASTKRIARKRSRWSRRPKGRPSNNQTLILSVLGAETLSTNEIYEQLRARKWKTASKTPRGLLSTTLRTMANSGKLRRFGDTWEVPKPPETETPREMHA